MRFTTNSSSCTTIGLSNFSPCCLNAFLNMNFNVNTVRQYMKDPVKTFFTPKEDPFFFFFLFCL